MSSYGSSGRYRLVEEAFQRAVDLPEDRWAEFLARECGSDPGLRREVEDLLRSYAAAGDLFDRPLYVAPGPAAAEVSDPMRIGRYRVLRRLGQGGMAVVFEAAQEQPQRSVAVKLIRPGALSARSLARFELEAAVLARLQHPGIAHIYEAGIAEVAYPGGGIAEQPFFAMELIEGETLAGYLARRKLDTGKRLGLFLKVCDAVAHAHQKGVIHRDLKPSNIIVTAAGEPKVLDFGIARVTESDLQWTTAHTEPASLVGTLPYMSPEQVSGRLDQLDTRSDVYALGVVLYELLAGRLPYDLADKPIAAAARTIADAPAAPLGSVARAYQGDLETIVSKALEKDPGRRYPSIQALSDDLRRFLAREPITARPPSAAYQFRKFAQRNKALVGGIAATIAALGLGVIGTGYGMVQMERQRDEARLQAGIVEAVNEFLTEDLLELADPRNEPDRDLTLSEALDRASKRIEGRFADAPVVEANLRKTMGRAYRHLDRLDEAEPHLRMAAELYRSARGEFDEYALLCRMELAALLMGRNELSAAEAMFGELIEVQRIALGVEHEQTIASLHNLGTIYLRQGRFADAEPVLRETLELRLRVLGEDNTHTAVTINNLATIAIYTGDVQRGVELLKRGLAIHQRVSGEAHPDTLQTLANLGGAYHSLKQYDEAEATLVRALELHRRVLGNEHRGTLAVSGMLAGVYGARRKPEREPLLAETLEVQRRVLGEDHPDTLVTGLNLARIAFEQGDFEAAAARHADLKERWDRVNPGHHLAAVTHLMHGRCLSELDRFEEAEQSLLAAHAKLTTAFGDAHERTGPAVEELVTLYDRWEKPDLAAEWRAKGDAVREQAHRNAGG